MQYLPPHSHLCTVDEAILPLEEHNLLAAVGAELVGRGRVAVVLLAGGDGSRLGFKGPKACYQIMDETTLLDVHLHLIMRDFKAAVKAAKIEDNHPSVRPLVYVMTSESNHDQISSLISSRNFPARVQAFCQSSLPVLDSQGHTLPDTAPAGNGAMYEALYTSGILNDMAKHGVRYASVAPIDNPAARPLDTARVGAAASTRAHVMLTCTQRAPGERYGALAVCSKPGEELRAVVREYSELPANDDVGDYNCGFTGSLIISLSQLKLWAANRVWRDLPVHKAHKEVKTHEGIIAGLKQEYFIFDVLEFVDISKVSLFLAATRSSVHVALKSDADIDTVREYCNRVINL